MDIVHEYDTRWYVIQDRYEYPGGMPRSMEDLKDRYCSVCRKLIRNRPWTGDENSKQVLLSSFSFDKGVHASSAVLHIYLNLLRAGGSAQAVCRKPREPHPGANCRRGGALYGNKAPRAERAALQART
jgi:hypothetical protein